MAKQSTADAGKKPGWIAQTRTFFGEVRSEMTKVSWPSSAEVKSSTQVVMFMLCALAAIVFVYDRVFDFVMRFLLSL